MNRLYRLVWNRTLGVLQVVSETATGRAAGAPGGGVVSCARPRLRAVAAGILAMLAGPMAAPAWSLPVLAGTSGFSVTTTGPAMVIDQTQAFGMASASSFDLASGESVMVHQDGASSAIAFSVAGGGALSQVDGLLTANGNVLLSNASGLAFGLAAQINSGGFLGSTLWMNSYAFDGQGALTTVGMVTSGPTGALVRNQGGTISAAANGSVVLVGAGVHNTGTISVDRGAINLVAADSGLANLLNGSFTIGNALQANVAAGSPAVVNVGTLTSNGGTITLQASGDSKVFGGTTLVQNGGNVITRGGTVNLIARGGDLANTGTLDVSPASSGGAGGKVSMVTDGLASVGGTVNASGGDVTVDAAVITLTGNVNADRAQLKASGAGGITQSAGALTVGSLSLDSQGDVALASAGNAINTLAASSVTGNLALTNSVALAQTGALSVSGSSTFATSKGDLLLTHAKNNFGGAVTVSASAGNVAVNAAGDLNMAGVSTGGSLSLVAGGVLSLGSQAIDVGSQALTLASNGGALLIDGALSGGDVSLSGRSALMLAGSVTASKALSLSSTGAIAQAAGAVQAPVLSLNAGGDVTLSSAANAIGALGASTVGGNLSLFSAGDLSQTGALSVAGTSTFTGSRNIDLTNAQNSFGGEIRVNAGSVMLRSADAIRLGNVSTTGLISVVAGRDLTVAGSSAVSNTVGDLTLAAAGGKLTVDGTLSGASVSLAASQGMALGNSITSGSVLTLDPGANQTAVVTGKLSAATTVINGGIVRVGAGGTSGSITGDIVNNGMLVYRRADNVAVGGAVSGSGGLTQEGGGRLDLTAANSYTGWTQVASGTLALSGAGSIANSAGVVLASAKNAVFDISGSKFSQVAMGALAGMGGTVVLGSKALSVGAGNASTTFGGTIAGTGGSLVKTGTGTLTLGGASTYDGGTELKQGRIDLANAGALGTGALAMDDGTTLGFAAGGLTLANDIRMTGTNDPVIDTGSFDATLAGAITGGGFLTKNGSGTLTLTSSANNYTGATDVAAGTLRAGAANTFSAGSAHSVASGATLDLAGFSQRIAGLNNSGTVSLTGATAGTTLTVTGAYVGNNGVLRMGTALGSSASVSDRLVLSGPAASASGQTTLQITNLGGLGALTTGNGIEIVSAENGATTTAQTTKNAFVLAGGHVDAGAYEYRLRPADAGGAGENWYLRSHTDAPVTPTEPTTPTTPTSPAEPSEAPQPQAPAVVPTPTYRAEVPLLAALPAQLRQADLAMLGNLHQRIGDDDPRDVSADAQRRAWARVLSSDIDIRQGGVANAQSDGRLSGLQAGTDLLALANWRAGVYVGQLDGNVSVSGFAGGVQNLAVGYNDVRNQYLGAYGTYTGAGGFYADAVLQGARQRIETAPTTNARSDGKGHSLLASIELGQSFAVGGSWKIEPQVQLVHRSLSLDDMNISGALVQQDSESDWVGRAGVRIRGAIGTGAGLLQPYARVNAYRASSGTDVVRFIGPAGSADIATPTGHTTWELAAGATLALGPAVDLYGEMGQLHASGGNEEVRSSVQGSVGLRVRW